MTVEEFMLEREEIPVTERGGFMMPFPSIFLEEDLSVNSSIPSEVFQATVIQWHEDLSAIVDKMEDCETRKWYGRAFLNDPPVVEKISGYQKYAGWKDFYETNEQGFPIDFYISRNGGGSLFYSPDQDKKLYVPLGRDTLYSRLSELKAKFFGYKFFDDEKSEVTMHAYSSHNVDRLPGALFLRNWAVQSVNAALVDLDKQGIDLHKYVLDSNSL